MDNNGWGNNPETEQAGIGHNSGEGWNNTEVAVEAEKLPTFDVKYESQPETEEPESFRLRRNAELQTWLDAKANLETIKTNERDCRDKITATLFPNPKKGTQRYDVGGGYKVKLQHTINYKLGDKDKLDNNGNAISIADQIEAMERDIIEKYGDTGEQVLKRLITWKPDFSGSQYEKLDGNNETEMAIKAIIQQHLTTEPGAPQLSFEEPKS